MEWLIDIIKEWVIAQAYATEAWVLAKVYATQAWVQAQGYLQTSFVNRGDPPVYDFSRTSFIKDNAWHELDLSSIVPAGAKVVLFAVVISNFSVARKFKFRRHGNVNDISCSAEETSMSLFLLRSDWTCPVDSDRKIDYWAQTPSENWDQMNVTIKGWWF